MRDAELWNRISHFEMDASKGSLPYSRKLAEVEDWKEAHALEVIAEYRRFIYLCMISEKQMTPSYDIDRAWHLHLTYTRNYWEEMCTILPRPLHHEPCLGPEEMPRYETQYEATKALYRDEFGEEPPRSVWPPGGAKEKVAHLEKAFGFSAIAFVIGIALANGLNLWIGGAVIFSAAITFAWAWRQHDKFGARGRNRRGASYQVGVGGCGGCGD